MPFKRTHKKTKTCFILAPGIILATAVNLPISDLFTYLVIIQPLYLLGNIAIEK